MLQRFLEARLGGRGIQGPAGTRGLLPGLHKSMCQAAEDIARKDGLLQALLEQLDRLLDALAVGRGQHPQELLEAHLDLALQGRVADKRPKLLLSLRYVFVPSQKDWRRADTRVRLDGERNGNVGQALGIAD